MLTLFGNLDSGNCHKVQMVRSRCCRSSRNSPGVEPASRAALVSPQPAQTPSARSVSCTSSMERRRIATSSSICAVVMVSGGESTLR